MKLMLPSVGPVLCLVLLASTLVASASHAARPGPVPDCPGRRCGPTTIKTLDVRVAVVRARATWTADDLDTIERLYTEWADEAEYLLVVQESADAIRVLRLTPAQGGADDTVVSLERAENGGTDISIPLPVEVRRRPPPVRAPRWVPTCGGCQVVSRFDHGDSQVVMLEGGGTPSYGMRRQATAMAMAGWTRAVSGERPRFPTARLMDEFHDGDRACMAVASSGSRPNRFHISLMCARRAPGR